MWPRQSCQLAGIPITEDPPVTSCLEFWPVSTIWKGTSETDPFLTEMIGPDTHSFEYIPLVLLSFSNIFYFAIQKRILLWYNLKFFFFLVFPHCACSKMEHGIDRMPECSIHSQNGMDWNVIDSYGPISPWFVSVWLHSLYGDGCMLGCASMCFIQNFGFSFAWTMAGDVDLWLVSLHENLQENFS